MEDAAAPPPLPLPPSQASSHFPLDPISGATLLEQERRRRDGLRARGNCLVGCRELDREVLLGGFERGCVVGLSAEEEEVGLLIGLQTIANLFVASLRPGGGDGPGQRPRAMVITTLSMGALLPVMWDVFRAQLGVRGVLDAGFDGLLKEFLGRISISRVFDVAGLWEALGELDGLAGQDGGGGADQEPPGGQQEEDTSDSEEAVGDREASSPPGEEHGEETPALGVVAEPASSPLSDPPSSLAEDFEATLPEYTSPPGQRTEIADSENEGGLSPLSSPKESPTPSVEVAKAVSEEPVSEQPSARKLVSGRKTRNEGLNKSEDQIHPDIILITHMSTLLSSLFRQREKDTAHQMLQLLSSHLRHLTRSSDHAGPLVMILNSTTSPSSSDTTAADNARPQNPDRPPPPPTRKNNNTSKPLDPTLRSIFNPPPLAASGLGYATAHDTPLSRRNKPSFGMVFTQLLDLHLLCTGVPRTRADAETVYAPLGEGVAWSRGKGGDVGRYGWVVEVLLDEVGVWEGLEGGRPRRSREQRWGAVCIFREEGGSAGVGGGGGGGVRVVDAFEWEEKVVPETRLAGGFGGRRV